jgi:hypothetical protein
MAERRRNQLQLRRVAVALLFALLPTLSYFGHWPVVALPVPTTAYVIPLPFGSEGSVTADHHTHCHGDADTCGRGAGSVVVVSSLLAAAVAIRFADGPLHAVPAAGWVPTRQHSPQPEHGPPRRHASTLAAS